MQYQSVPSVSSTSSCLVNFLNYSGNSVLCCYLKYFFYSHWLSSKHNCSCDNHQNYKLLINVKSPLLLNYNFFRLLQIADSHRQYSSMYTLPLQAPAVDFTKDSNPCTCVVLYIYIYTSKGCM